MNDTKTNKTNVTNETNVTDVVEEVIVYPENYEDLNCEKFSADQRFCEKCKFFFYFDKTEIICKMVNPLCKSYD